MQRANNTGPWEFANISWIGATQNFAPQVLFAPVNDRPRSLICVRFVCDLQGRLRLMRRLSYRAAVPTKVRCANSNRPWNSSNATRVQRPHRCRWNLATVDTTLQKHPSGWRCYSSSQSSSFRHDVPELRPDEAAGLLRVLGLGLSDRARPQLIKERYFALAKRMHPDVQAWGVENGNSQPWFRFAEITTAFERLIQDAKLLEAQQTTSAQADANASDNAQRKPTLNLRTVGAAASEPRGLSAAEESCIAALEEQLGADGAAALHKIADQVEEEGDTKLGSVVGIDGRSFDLPAFLNSITTIFCYRCFRRIGEAC
eukprot:SAG31_NODE_612_length_13548_cov_171.183285_1_plen_315_part_00